MSGSTAPTIFEFTVDLQEQEAPVPLPPGEYPAEITQAENRVSGNTGNVYCAITFRIAPENYPADYTEGDPDGTTLTYNRLLLADKPRERHRLRKFLESVGAKLGRSFDPNDLIGLHATVVIEHRQFEGEDQAQISRVMGG